jgi:phosphoglucomutase
LAGRFAAEAARILAADGFAAELSARPVPTPVLAYEIRRRGAAGAINFTASHNPPQYLGIKLSTADGAPTLPEVTRRIEAEVAAAKDIAEPVARQVPTFDPVPAYLEDIGRKVAASDVGRGRLFGCLSGKGGSAADPSQ